MQAGTHYGTGPEKGGKKDKENRNDRFNYIPLSRAFDLKLYFYSEVLEVIFPS